MPIVHDNLARPQVDLVADACKVLFVLFKDALKRRLEFKGGKGARPLELHGGIAARIHVLGPLVQLVGFRVVEVIVVVEGRGAESRALGRRFHGARMAAPGRCGFRLRVVLA